MKKILGLAIVLATSAWGSAVLTLPSGLVQLGVNDYGNLGAGSLPDNSNVPGGLYGIYLVAQNADGIAPGCFCEGWGVTVNGSSSGWASYDDGGISNLSLISFASTATTADSETSLTGSGLPISQVYSPSTSGNLFEDRVTLTNNGSTPISNVEYTRSMDWDINPTEFNEYVTIGGVGASALVYSTDNGFCTPDALTPCSEIVPGTTNANVKYSGPADHGSYFVFGFGGLAPGASTSFDIFFGAATGETAAVNALSTVKAEVYALGYASDGPAGGPDTAGGVWAFGFSGVGGAPIGGGGGGGAVPEPATWAMMGCGLAGLLVWRRKK